MKSEISQARFWELMEANYADVARFAAAMTRNRQEAADLAGETMLHAYESFTRLRKEEAFKNFVFTICSRLHKRQRWRRRRIAEYDESLARAIADPAPGPEFTADVQALYDALALLPRRQREALVLFEINGLSLAEIHSIQGGTLSGVKARVARGRRKLSRLMRPAPEREHDIPDNVMSNRTEDSPAPLKRRTIDAH